MTKKDSSFKQTAMILALGDSGCSGGGSGGGGILCLRVESVGEDSYEWAQDYTFDEIYDAAINGKLTCVLFGHELSDGVPDIVHICPFKCAYLKNHSDGARVTFVHPFADDFLFEWTPDGFNAYSDA